MESPQHAFVRHGVVVLHKINTSTYQAFKGLLVKAFEEKPPAIRVNLGDKNLNFGD